MRLEGPKLSVVAGAVLLCAAALLQGCSSYYSSNNNNNNNNNNPLNTQEHCANESSRQHLHSIRRRSVGDVLSQLRLKKMQESLLDLAHNIPDWLSGLGNLWNCKSVGGEQGDEQHAKTTQLLLFTEPRTGDKPQAIVNKYSSRDDLKHKGGFKPKAPTYVMVHGFRGCGVLSQPWFVNAKELILNKGEANVFFVDWGHHARVLSYAHALGQMPVIAAEIYEIMHHYELAFASHQFKMTSLKLVGHSLGAHISGLLGQLMHGQLEEITATDPAGVSFSDLPDNHRLSPNDAKYVQAIHTNAAQFGTEMNVAHRDIFYENGSQQPACSSLPYPLLHVCSHKMATRYASAYMGRCVQVAYKCAHHRAFDAGACGFCRPDTDDCVAVGHAWQYDLGEHQDKLNRHKRTGKHKGEREGEEEEEGATSRYYLKSGPDEPYCAYHFQVVVWFSDSSPMGHREEFRLRLIGNTTSGLPAEVTMRRHRKRAGEQLLVFDEAGELDTVEGKHLYTGLALVRPAHLPLYHLMPLKFAWALLPDDIKEPARGLKVYVNFMSHPRLSERAAYSGPIGVRFAPIIHRP